MSKEQLETVQQSVDFTEIRVGPYALHTIRSDEDIILAEANELRAFWKALFPSLTDDLHDRNKWGTFKTTCPTTALFDYVRDLDERSLNKKSFRKVLPSAAFFPVVDVGWFVKFTSGLMCDELINLISTCTRLSSCSSPHVQQPESEQATLIDFKMPVY
jgi:hypothetical protein